MRLNQRFLQWYGAGGLIGSFLAALSVSKNWSEFVLVIGLATVVASFAVLYALVARRQSNDRQARRKRLAPYEKAAAAVMADAVRTIGSFIPDDLPESDRNALCRLAWRNTMGLEGDEP